MIRVDLLKLKGDTMEVAAIVLIFILANFGLGAPGNRTPLTTLQFSFVNNTILNYAT